MKLQAVPLTLRLTSSLQVFNKIFLGTISYPKPTTSTAFTNLAYSVSYPTALSGVKYTVALGINDMKIKLPNTYMLKFTIHQTTTTGFVMNVTATGSNF
jgi:hypothetical protein